MRGFLIFLLVLLGLLLAVDRIGVAIAQDRVAAELQTELELTREPDVQINGFPVLDQAIVGNYRDVELSLDDADLGDLSGLDVVVRLQGVRIPLPDLVSADIDAVPVELITGTVTVPYAQVAEQLGSGVTVANSPDGVVVSDTFDIFGEEQSIAGTGEVSVDGGDIVVTVVGLKLNDTELDESELSNLREALSFRYTVPALPIGIQITDVVATDGGFEVSGRTADVVLDSESVETG